jgi:hypothetical protein
MASRRVREHMRGIAIERVLENRDNRPGIGNLAALR